MGRKRNRRCPPLPVDQPVLKESSRMFAENCDVDDHPSPDLNADMSEFDGDVADVDVGKHCQEV